MIHVFLANGFEEIEALAPTDILRRLGLDVSLVSLNEGLGVEGAHGIRVEADCLFADAGLEISDALILPGGMPGASHLAAHEGLRQALLGQDKAGRLIAAICAAPMVLGQMGLLQGRRATCYPGFEAQLTGATCTARPVEADAHFITARGAGVALDFGFAIARRFVGDAPVDALREGMMANQN